MRDRWSRLPRWSRVVIGGAAAVTTGAAGGVVFAPGIPRVWAAAAGSFLALAAAGSAAGVRMWQERLGRLTAVAAVALVWAAGLSAVMLAAPDCPGSGPGRCNASELSTWAGVGALFPIVVAALASVPVSFASVVRKVVRVHRRVLGGDGEVRRRGAAGRGRSARRGRG